MTGENTANEWTYTFTGLPKYNVNGDEIEYIINEQNPGNEFYQKSSIDQEQRKITNTFVVPGEKITIPVEKIWDDNNNIAKKRPTSVTIQVKNGEQVVAEETLSEGTNWKKEISVAKYDSLGREIIYTVEEKDLNNIFYTSENTEVTGDQVQGFKVTNKFVVPDENTEVSVTKVWEDNGNEKGRRPESIIVSVEGDQDPSTEGNEITKEYELTGESTVNEWTYTFTELPKYDINGNEIEYTIDEKDLNNGFYEKANVDQAQRKITNKMIKIPMNVITKYLEKGTNKVLAEEERIEGYEGQEYETKQKEIENYVLIEDTKNTKGTMVLSKNPDGTYNTEIEVIYYYLKQAGGVIENHIDITTNEKIETQEHKGNVGDSYDIPVKEFAGYDIVNEKLPDNSKGKMTEDKIVVNYYYIKQAKLTVEYIDKQTGEKLDEKEIKGHIGDNYKTEEKQFPYYKYVEKAGSTEGKMTEDKMTVIYYYEKQIFNLSVDKWISGATIDGVSQQGQNYNTKDQLYKIDIHRKKTTTAEVKITYTIRISNTGEIEGTVGEIVELIPEGYTYNQKDNEIHWEGKNRTLTTDILKEETIKPGEYREIKIVLRWEKGENNFGEKDNIVTLAKVTNPAGYEDINNEDNKDEAKMIITISTGIEAQIKMYIIIGVLLSLIATGIIIARRLREMKQ